MYSIHGDVHSFISTHVGEPYSESQCCDAHHVVFHFNGNAIHLKLGDLVRIEDFLLTLKQPQYLMICILIFFKYLESNTDLHGNLMS